MAREIQEAKTGNRALETAIAKLWSLSNDSQTAIVSIIDRLAEVEGVSFNVTQRPPIENISHWLTKLRSERRDIKLCFHQRYSHLILQPFTDKFTLE